MKIEFSLFGDRTWQAILAMKGKVQVATYHIPEISIFGFKWGDKIVVNIIPLYRTAGEPIGDAINWEIAHELCHVFGYNHYNAEDNWDWV